jgi:hypothetical protein
MILSFYAFDRHFFQVSHGDTLASPSCGRITRTIPWACLCHLKSMKSITVYHIYLW